MSIKLTLENRLKQLDWSIYKLAKAYAQMQSIRNDEPQSVHQPSRYHSTLGKFLDNPESSKVETLNNVVKTLGGRLVIQWNDSEFNDKSSPIDIEDVFIQQLKSQLEPILLNLVKELENSETIHQLSQLSSQLLAKYFVEGIKKSL